jgi:hypothetical protein
MASREAGGLHESTWRLLQPALESFYGSLSDEQKARFDQLGAQQG